MTSPFGRKVRLAAHVLGLGERLTIVHADVYDAQDTIRQQNPLGKMPCLVRADGSALIDSGVIVEFLQHVAGSDQLVPLAGPQRFATLSRARVGDGIMEAGALMIYEGMWHEAAQVSQRWIDHQRGKVERALASFEQTPPHADRTDIVGVVMACALEFLDRRKPVAWRPDCPRLVEWFDGFVRREPGFARIKEGDK